MDLDERHLLPAFTGSTGTIRPGATTRLEGALLGAVIGNALGVPRRHQAPAHRRTRDLRAGNRLGAEGRLLVSWAGRLAASGRSAAPELAERLRDGRPRLHSPGPAVVTTQRRLRAGAPWFAAGPDSFGNGGLLRAVADGARWVDDPSWRPWSAALGGVLTHAHPRAVAASVLVAELVAAGIADPDLLADPVEQARRFARQLGDTALLEAIDRPGADGGEPTAVDSVARALHLAARDTSARSALLAAADAGGPSDVVAGLVGALRGARDGVDALPRRWRTAVDQADRTIRRARRLAAVQALADAPDTTGGRSEEDRTHIWFLIDRSGSMGPLRQAVIDGFNGFLAEQQAMPGRARLTLVQFDGHQPFDVLVDGARLDRVHPLDHRYEPRGSTPLYDAIGTLLDSAERRAADRERRGRPAEDQLVVVFTDGHENASRRWDRAEIFDRIEARKGEGWTFAYLGANQDAYGVGFGVGVGAGSISDVEHTYDGHLRAYADVSRAASAWRAKSPYERCASVDDFFEGVKATEQPTSG